MAVNLTLSLGTLEIPRITASAISTDYRGGFSNGQLPDTDVKQLPVSSGTRVTAGGGATRLAEGWAVGRLVVGHRDYRPTNYSPLRPPGPAEATLARSGRDTTLIT